MSDVCSCGPGFSARLIHDEVYCNECHGRVPPMKFRPALPTEFDLHADPSSWQAGDRCPFCLASDGPVADEDGDFALCHACDAEVVYPGDELYEDLPARFNVPLE